VFHLDLDDTLQLLDLAAAVRMHGIAPAEVPDYLDGLNASPSVCRLAMRLAQDATTPRNLAMRLENLARGAAPKSCWRFEAT
jgi:hypothetical protein